MSIGYIDHQGTRIELVVTGMSEVQNINGSKQLIVHIEPIIPTGPRGPGEPVELPRAA